jgi:ADP-heptose:LPS heptosyltransferase
MKVPDLRSLRTVALVELNRLGDLVHGLQAARVFKKNLPDATITMVVDQKYAGLARLEPAVDHVIGARDTRGIPDLIKTALHLRRMGFDCVCSLSPILRNAIVARLGRARFAVGYLSTGPRKPNFLKESQISSIGCDVVEKEVYGFEHISLTALKVCRSLGLTDTSWGFEPHLQDLGQYTLPNQPYLVFHPFAGWRFREWPEENRREFLERVLATTEYRVVVIGTSDEVARLGQLDDATRWQNRVSFQPGLTMENLVVLLQQASVFIGTDSGPYQLACALGVPTVGLLGPAPPEITGSTGSSDRVLYHRLDCSPCLQHSCVRPANACMRLISPDEAVKEVENLLTATRGKGTNSE